MWEFLRVLIALCAAPEPSEGNCHRSLGEVRHSPCHGLRFAHIVKNDHQAGNTTAAIMDWRR
jgi:hypothetical protein